MSSSYSPSQNAERVSFLSTLHPVSLSAIPENQNCCTICFSPYTGANAVPPSQDGESSPGIHFATTLPCGHYFGHCCIQEWFNQLNVNACPLCRTSYFTIPADEKVAREQTDISASSFTNLVIPPREDPIATFASSARAAGGFLTDADLAILPPHNPSIYSNFSWIRQDLQGIAGRDLLGYLVDRYSREIFNAPPGRCYPFGVMGFDIGEAIRADMGRLRVMVERRIRGNEEYLLDCIAEVKCEEMVNALERQGRREGR